MIVYKTLTSYISGLTIGDETRTTFLGILDEGSKSGLGKEHRPDTLALSPTKSFRIPTEFSWTGGESSVRYAFNTEK